MSTPTEQAWEGVTQLPDYKPSFPKWRDYHLEQKMDLYLDKNGLELLSVYFLIFASFLILENVSLQSVGSDLCKTNAQASILQWIG